MINVYPWKIPKISSWANENKIKRTRKRGTTIQKKSLPNSGATLFVPQENSGHKIKSINTPLSPLHSAWVTAERIEREKRDLSGVTMWLYFHWQVDPTPQWQTSKESRLNPKSLPSKQTLRTEAV
jgi:hypothetical protein